MYTCKKYCKIFRKEHAYKHTYMYRHGPCVVFVGNTDCQADIQINEQTRLAERHQSIRTSTWKQQKHLFHIITVHIHMYCIYILASWQTDRFELGNKFYFWWLFIQLFLVVILIWWYFALCVIAILFWLHSFIIIVLVCVLKHSFITMNVSQIDLI